MIPTGVIGGRLGYQLLRRLGRNADSAHYCEGTAYSGRSKLEALFGPGVWPAIEGRVVMDFGCGAGTEVVEAAQHGAAHVVGMDIREESLAVARRTAREAGVEDRCSFTTQPAEPVDVIFSIDGFEHYADPALVLRTMARLLRPQGSVWIAFGPTWLHPLGGHLFSIFPWSHLIFTEKALIRWRSDFKSDGARRFGEVAGGLNQMTIRRFQRLVQESPFEMGSFETVPIRKARVLHNRITREFLTAIVRCRLVARQAAAAQGPRAA
jgi:SAM-dependent methyltransferase